ncbi:hypothetical protein [Stratiformator vulcanicus]|uniref:Uncharacterized protein n=1 Tax=Stratiformator vulcanicus TaxID=2527980 RepID=A0A517QW80_9PLAN|nr:hypothetical protein [Stratiformator vulcanicus]QDT35847.1 hypothetical protein Pan189_02000 [Stratiformator vulcanicus]
MSLETIPIACDNCGATLDVGPASNYATCAHCGSKLAIRRTESATYTELLERLESRTERIEQRLDEFGQLSSVEQLDREWQMERENFMITGKNGHRQVPTKGMSVVGGVFVTCFGIFWTVMALAITGGMAAVGSGAGLGLLSIIPLIFPLFGVAFTIGGIVISIHAYRKAEEYEKAENRYKQRRRELVTQ